ncbi:MAG TPA: peptidoglycan-binding protein [Pyrinomonadaceae bacterium]|nr:peptidoglycan-binding protein [Pyrinomonadaceae bacterium]
MTTWLTKVFDFNVERKEIPRKNNKPFIPMSPTGVGVLHTTEGLNVDGAWSTLKAHFSAPHFIVGGNRIIQCRPLGVQAAALLDNASHPNKDAYVQIEMCAFTGGNANFQKHGMDSWIPIESTLKPLAALMAYCTGNGIDIPLRRPSDAWLDDCSDIKTIWATAGNTRRGAGVWPKEKGWYYHLEVPGNNHYDCGAMRCADIFAMAKALVDGSPQPAEPQPAATQPATPQPAAPTPSTPQAAPASVLKEGDKGDRVKQLQVKLIALGLLKPGSDTGNFASHTLEAVRKFQSARGLKVDGKVGPDTEKALDEAVAAS